MDDVTKRCCDDDAPALVNGKPIPDSPTIVAVVAHPASPSFHWVYLSDGRVLHFQADTGKIDRVIRVPLDKAAQ